MHTEQGWKIMGKTPLPGQAKWAGPPDILIGIYVRLSPPPRISEKSKIAQDSSKVADEYSH